MPDTGDRDSRLSEFELIELFAERPPDPDRILQGIGDDAAVVRAADRTITSVDTAVDGVHFRREWSSAEQIAGKAVGSALSDLAAMGAGENGADLYISLGAPRDTDSDFLRRIAAGAIRTADIHGATLAGGDTVSSPTLFLGITVTAHIDEGEPVTTRSGARPGDLVAVTGSLGAASAGLWLLENPGLPVSPEVSPEDRRKLIGRQLEAVPRLAAGAALARAGARAMIDLSDGLVADLAHIVRSSSNAGGPLRARIEAERLPSARGAEAVAVAAGLDPLTPVLRGGEDYELVVTLPPDREAEAVEAVEATGLRLTVIGRIESAAPTDPPVLTCRDGEPVGPDPSGFDHFA
ncbi:MAG: thiamine-phosphate kinase [Solirubrobacterales bacterium]|nr:thiamine-phosphate kinase [Solirubrobacterales bacterium]